MDLLHFRPLTTLNRSRLVLSKSKTELVVLAPFFNSNDDARKSGRAHVSLANYRKVQAAAGTPRSNERRLVSEITGEMIVSWERGCRGAQLMPVLHRNREMWTTFSCACGAAGNALPAPVRAGIISLALWVDRFTSDVVAEREEIAPLIEVNQDLLEGLLH